MGYHYDAIDELAPGTGVAIVSLGATRTLRFRLQDDREIEHPWPLPGGSLLYMPPELQHTWKHGVPRQPGAGPRISLTFRCLRSSDVAQDSGQPNSNTSGKFSCRGSQ